MFAICDAGLDTHPLADDDRRPTLTVVDATVDVTAAPEGLTAPVWSARWTGTLTPTVDGPHRFTVLAARITRLEIDGAVVAAGEREFGQVFDGPPLPVEGTADGNVRLGWQPPDDRIQEATRLAAGSDVAVVVASTAVGEGMDRASLGLPGDQDRLTPPWPRPTRARWWFSTPAARS